MLTIKKCSRNIFEQLICIMMPEGQLTKKRLRSEYLLDVRGFAFRAEMLELNFETAKKTAIVNMYNDA